MSKIDIKALLEAGAHFGHKTSRWNPNMEPYIHSKRGGIHIINLEKTVEQLESAVKFSGEVAASGKQILFVGTKKHIAPVVAEAAETAGMPFVTERWFGGMLTNFSTISSRIKYYKKLKGQLESGELEEDYNKREIQEFHEELDKMAKDLSGIAEMDRLPGAVFISDVITEKTAVKEANRLNIPVIAIVDSNGNPEGVDYVIPANDDAVKTVKLIADAISKAVLDAVKGKQAASTTKATETKTANKKPAAKKKQATTGKQAASTTKSKKTATSAKSGESKKTTSKPKEKKED